MRALKISTIIITLLFFVTASSPAEKISCKKYSGTYEDYTFTISFFSNGKMLIAVDSKNRSGFFSSPGSYMIKGSRLDFFYKGLSRSIYFENDRILASFYSFNLAEDYENKIVLTEDKSYPATCR